MCTHTESEVQYPVEVEVEEKVCEVVHKRAEMYRVDDYIIN